VNTKTPKATTTATSGAADIWTEERIRALGVVTDLPTAARIFGLGRSLAYELVRTDRFPCPVLHAGTRYRVPVAAILTALGITPGRDLTPDGQQSVDHHAAITSGPAPAGNEERTE
jgi:hypothetical protein